MRRKVILGLTAAGVLAAGTLWLRPVASEVDKVEQVKPGVYFHEGDLHGHGHCNNGWVVFDDYVVVVDANFPSGAKVVIPKIKALTEKPIRFAFDTHHHGDHAYGNQIWAENGAIPVASSGALDEMKKYETGYYGGKPGRWEDTAKGRPDVAATKLKPPTVLFPREMVFDDGTHRMELKWLGVAHTRGDGWAWLPKEKILFSGDACVNGPYNYVGDGEVGAWIKTLEAAQKLGAKTVVPGHGPIGDGTLLEDQRQFFLEIRKQAQRLRDGRKSPLEAQAQVAQIKAEVLKKGRIKRYVGDFFDAQIEKAYVELGGMPFPPKMAVRSRSKLQHASDHSLPLLGAPVLPGPKYARGSK
jgi:glyoxylase-like metal-dependent hydrolase (beta-lactamase superfamily II)